MAEEGDTAVVEEGRLGRSMPRHVAIIMDGNGRWAERRKLPRHFGHKAGVDAVRKVVSACGERGIEVLTLFAFSSENWRRPAKEVGLLMELFLTTLQKEIKRLHKNKVRIRLIGDLSAFPEKLQQRIAEAERVTADNDGLTLVIAANYGGRWDIAQAAARLAGQVKAGTLEPGQVDAERLAAELSLADLPEPDLFIRTGGEQRISNFLLWQLAYTELYFTDRFWPDFDAEALDEAIASFGSRQRRFGMTGHQVESLKGA
ncbi:isoprenyl transferase [Endothiovibrio diazotrophicus]